MSVTTEMRRRIAQRADHRCEYCLLHEDHAVKKHEPDHIIPVKHGGGDHAENLAWACFECNRFKGSEVGAFDELTGQLVAVFNPRLEHWQDHFSIKAGELIAQTDVGRVTILVLQFNRLGRIRVRKILAESGLYP